MKVAILHDYFDKEGGGERLVLALAKAFDADIYTGFIDYKKTFPELAQRKVTQISKDTKIPGIRNLKLLRDFSKLRLSGYDLYIFSGIACISAVEHHKPNLLYLHTPPRFVYDLRDWFMQEAKLWQKPFLAILRWYWKKQDQKYMNKFDHIISNSQHVKDRVSEYYGESLAKKTDVVYSIVDHAAWTPGKKGTYYVSYGRLDSLKRIDVIVRSFQQMPDKKLIVLGDGPERESIKKLCEGYPNITFIGRLPQTELRSYVANCIASIYLPIREDMGLIPLECAAAGKPTIGANEGGLKEMIKPDKTGLLIEPTVDALIEAVNYLDADKAESMKSDCIKWGKSFSEENFMKRVTKILKKMKMSP